MGWNWGIKHYVIVRFDQRHQGPATRIDGTAAPHCMVGVKASEENDPTKSGQETQVKDIQDVPQGIVDIHNSVIVYGNSRYL